MNELLWGSVSALQTDGLSGGYWGLAGRLFKIQGSSAVLSFFTPLSGFLIRKTAPQRQMQHLVEQLKNVAHQKRSTRKCRSYKARAWSDGDDEPRGAAAQLLHRESWLPSLVVWVKCHCQSLNTLSGSEQTGPSSLAALGRWV
jgi:hypothetical protein